MAMRAGLDSTLTLAELRAFWKRLERMDDSPARDALMTCLLLGGQRPSQMLRVTVRQVDVTAQTVTLLDPRGAIGMQARVGMCCPSPTNS